MDLFGILRNIYTKNNINWLNDVDQSDEIQPFLLNKWLSMDNNLQKEVRYLDKYVFYLEPKQFMMLAWSVVPKTTFKFNKYIKKNDEIEEEYNFLITKVRKKLEISDNDWKESKHYYLEDIEKNKTQYFKSFGIDKKTWKKFGLDYKEISKEKEVKKENINNLNKWF
jgi:hypothetical protein